MSTVAISQSLARHATLMSAGTERSSASIVASLVVVVLLVMAVRLLSPALVVINELLRVALRAVAAVVLIFFAIGLLMTALVLR